MAGNSMIRGATEYSPRAAAIAGKWLDESSEDEFVVDFLDRHGQSLDYIFTGKPDAMICGLAAMSKQAAQAA